MPKGKPTTPDKIEQAVALAKTSMTQNEIAEVVGISRRTLVRILDKAGFRRTSASERRTLPSTRSSPIYNEGLSRTIGLHHDNLLALVTQLRDEVAIPPPHRLPGTGVIPWEEPWTGLSSGPPILGVANNALFPYVMKHLSQSGLFENIEALQRGMVDYLKGARILESKIADVGMNKAKELCIGLWSEEVANALVASILLDAFYRETGAIEIDFKYHIERVDDAAEQPLRISFGAWGVRSTSGDHATLVRQLHETVRFEIKGCEEARALAETYITLEAQKEALIRNLQPEDRFRKIFAETRCDLCH